VAIEAVIAVFIGAVRVNFYPTCCDAAIGSEHLAGDDELLAGLAKRCNARVCGVERILGQCGPLSPSMFDGFRQGIFAGQRSRA